MNSTKTNQGCTTFDATRPLFDCYSKNMAVYFAELLLLYNCRAKTSNKHTDHQRVLYLFAPCMKVSGDVAADAGVVDRHRRPVSVPGRSLQLVPADPATFESGIALYLWAIPPGKEQSGRIQEQKPGGGGGERGVVDLIYWSVDRTLQADWLIQ